MNLRIMFLQRIFFLAFSTPVTEFVGKISSFWLSSLSLRLDKLMNGTPYDEKGETASARGRP